MLRVSTDDSGATTARKLRDRIACQREAAKALYKTEPATADSGEVVIYAPHITKVSYTHGLLIGEVGYHVRDYFLKQEGRFQNVPGTIKAHSTHVKGIRTCLPRKRRSVSPHRRDARHRNPRRLLPAG
jgi:hypothetical protein